MYKNNMYWLISFFSWLIMFELALLQYKMDEPLESRRQNPQFYMYITLFVLWINIV